MPAAFTMPALSQQQRKSGIMALMVSTFFAWGGFFLVIPLVAVHYVDDLGWAAGAVGIALAVRQLSQQTLTIGFGMLCDRIGPKPLICTGMLVRALGFLAMAWAESFTAVVLALLLAGLGGSLYESPKSAALAALASPEERRRLFSTIGVIAGVGTTVGTQIGALLIPYDFALVCIAGTIAYVIIFFQLLIMMPHIKVSSGGQSQMAGLGMVFRDRRFMIFLAILTGYYFATTQFGLTITLAATRITGTEAAVSWIYAVNAAATIGFGYILPRFLERWISSLGLLMIGTAIVGIGLAMVGFAASTLGILLAAGVFSLGSILARPGQETVTANLADPAARGTYFGVASLSLAIGGSLGNYLGGVIYEGQAEGENASGPWILFAGIAIVTSFALWLYGRWYTNPEEELALIAAPATSRRAAD